MLFQKKKIYICMSYDWMNYCIMETTVGSSIYSMHAYRFSPYPWKIFMLFYMNQKRLQHHMYHQLTDLFLMQTWYVAICTKIIHPSKDKNLVFFILHIFFHDIQIESSSQPYVLIRSESDCSSEEP
jgi:hypothetical protein